MLSRADITAIHRTRERLRALESRLELAEDRPYDTGRLAESCRAADDALLQILIIANVRNLGVSGVDLDPIATP